MDKSVMTAKEVATEYFGGTVSYWKILEEFKAGRMPGFKVGNRIFFRRETLDKWVAEEEIRSIDRAKSEDNQYGKLRRIV